MVLVYLLFISFAPPKETKQRKEAFLYEFFDNEVKNRFQNFASLRTSVPVFKAFDPHANWLLAANSHWLFLNRSPLPHEFFTAWGLKIYSDFPPRKPGRFRQRQKTLSQNFHWPLP
jgi:hypothetical protein